MYSKEKGVDCIPFPKAEDFHKVPRMACGILNNRTMEWGLDSGENIPQTDVENNHPRADAH